MTELLVYFFICTTAIFLYSTYNTMKKIEDLEEIIEEQDSEYFQIKSNIRETIKLMRSIDSKEAFEKDDETGTVFTALLELVESLEDTDEE